MLETLVLAVISKAGIHCNTALVFLAFLIVASVGVSNIAELIQCQWSQHWLKQLAPVFPALLITSSASVSNIADFSQHLFLQHHSLQSAPVFPALLTAAKTSFSSIASVSFFQCCQLQPASHFCSITDHCQHHHFYCYWLQMVSEFPPLLIAASTSVSCVADRRLQ